MHIDWKVAREEAFVEAIALKKTADYLDAQLMQPGIEGDPLAVAGFGFSTNLLKLLAAEVALKALYIQEHGCDAPHIHELDGLFSALSETAQEHIHRLFLEKQIVSAALRVLETEEGLAFNNFLVDLSLHSKSFVEWRNFYARKPEAELGSNFAFLNLFLESLLEVYRARV